MANQDDNPDLGRGAAGGRSSRNQPNEKRGDDSEWLQDQIGEDHNLSGSDTYRTLPDQPPGEEEDESTKDTNDRQSNR